MRPPFLVLALAIACTGTAKREAAVLVEAVDRFRTADNAQRPAAAPAVRAAACTDAEVCDAKRACVAMVDPTVRAIELKNEVAARVDDLEKGRLSPDDPVAKGLSAKLDEAQRALAEGRAAMDACERKLTDLRIRYGL